jgi:hypothetical protein
MKELLVNLLSLIVNLFNHPRGHSALQSFVTFTLHFYYFRSLPFFVLVKFKGGRGEKKSYVADILQKLVTATASISTLSDPLTQSADSNFKYQHIREEL